MSKPSIAIIGASNHRGKFGNRAVRSYLKQGYDVYPIHPTAPTIEGLPAYPSILDVPVTRLDRVSLYVAPEVGMQLIDDVAKKQPGEVWLNPGAENPELIAKARGAGLKVIVACSIVAIGANPHADE